MKPGIKKKITIKKKVDKFFFCLIIMQLSMGCSYNRNVVFPEIEKLNKEQKMTTSIGIKKIEIEMASNTGGDPLYQELEKTFKKRLTEKLNISRIGSEENFNELYRIDCKVKVNEDASENGFAAAYYPLIVVVGISYLFPPIGILGMYGVSAIPHNHFEQACDAELIIYDQNDTKLIEKKYSKLLVNPFYNDYMGNVQKEDSTINYELAVLLDGILDEISNDLVTYSQKGNIGDTKAGVVAQ